MAELDKENVILTLMCFSTLAASTWYRSSNSMCEITPRELIKPTLAWSWKIKINAENLTYSASIALKLSTYLWVNLIYTKIMEIIHWQLQKSLKCVLLHNKISLPVFSLMEYYQSVKIVPKNILILSITESYASIWKMLNLILR